MTPKQFDDTIDRVGLTQLGTARLFSLGERTIRRYSAGQRRIHPCAVIILRLLLKKRITVEDIERARDER